MLMVEMKRNGKEWKGKEQGNKKGKKVDAVRPVSIKMMSRITKKNDKKQDNGRPLSHDFR